MELVEAVPIDHKTHTAMNTQQYHYYIRTGSDGSYLQLKYIIMSLTGQIFAKDYVVA